MDDHKLLADWFEDSRAHLRAVAYRMLGSRAEADDAVQETWIKLSRADRSGVENMTGWLTTVVARVCLDMLRSRKARREDAIGTRMPDPIISRDDGLEHQAVIADSVGIALLVVLETLEPAERLAFVLHDLFAMPFDAIAPIVGRTPTAARQLASRARRRVQGAAPGPDADLRRQREVVDAFLAASRRGDFEALLEVLDPDVIHRADRGGAPGEAHVVRGAARVANNALAGARRAHGELFEQAALVNGAAGLVVFAAGRPFAVLGFTIARGRIIEINVFADPARLARLDLQVMLDERAPS